MPPRSTCPPHFPDAALMTLVRSTPLAICITDADGCFQVVNAAYCRLYGYTEEELLGEEFTLVVAPEHREMMRTMHRAFIETGEDNDPLIGKPGARAEWEVLDRQGRSISILAEAVRLEDDQGNVYKATFVVDISEHKALERSLRKANQRLTQIAMYDELTGLQSRRAGLERLEAEIHEQQRYGHPLCIAVIDLDGFKQINDTHGHAIGDEILVGIAELLRRSLRESDAAIRLGGDELLLVLPGVTLDQATQAVERIRQALAATPLTRLALEMTLSAGIADYRNESQDALLERADRALYRAKRRGRNRLAQAT
ncbi:sensor domain-containing diguanylate cyclase [Salinicola endophyticus]|uniref:diguanylate cyclase n=1 Tax=Salinicola endophyticus TaxID=1949083 RepID=A0ABY8FER7_9GAMM|nr:sensor domain-containing diguanylate cyclase [Salinicola endophyticus]WFF41314.1 sensor domain-containing diguanylate cyclase [Salinicola endophyticus]